MYLMKLQDEPELPEWKTCREGERVSVQDALACQIMIQQNGMIDVKSEVGKGTEFHMKWYCGSI